MELDLILYALSFTILFSMFAVFANDLVRQNKAAKRDQEIIKNLVKEGRY